MIRITRDIARRFRAIVRKTLRVRPKGLQPTIVLTTTEDGIVMRAANKDAAVEFRCDGHGDQDELRVPLQLLQDCEGRQSSPVVIEQIGSNRIAAQWEEGIVANVRQYDTETQAAFPSLPSNSNEVDSALVQALADASQITDSESSRFATDSILLAADGKLAATDGRQLLVYRGYDFPWEEDILLPSNSVLQSNELVADSIAIGKTDDQVVIRSGQWKLWLPVRKEGRFPDVDSITKPSSAKVATATFSSRDAEFLVAAIRRLPTDDNHNRPVTVDMNGSIAIRSRDESGQVSELRLAESSIDGDAISVNLNRDYLARALSLGFRQLHVEAADQPIQCRDGSRIYIWAPLEAGEVIKATDDAIVIEPTGQLKSMRRSRRKTTPRVPSTSDQRAAAAVAFDHVDVTKNAETIRSKLRSMLHELKSLASELKRYHKQAEFMQSALATFQNVPRAA